VLNRNAFQLHSFEAANIYRGYPIALRIGAFSVRVNAAVLAKTVLDHMLVEGVYADVVVGSEHAQLIAGDKPQERSFTGTHGTIACHGAIDLAFDLEGNFPAMTTTFVLHVGPP